MNGEAKPHPLDVSVLNKGDYLSGEQIREIVGKTPGTDEYRFGLLGLRQWIGDELAQAGKKWTLKIEGDGIRILTDPEASKYNANMIELDFRSMWRRQDLNLAVDQSQLTVEDRQRHEHNLIIHGKMLLRALETKDKTIRLLAHKRTVPVMIEELVGQQTQASEKVE